MRHAASQRLQIRSVVLWKRLFRALAYLLAVVKFGTERSTYPPAHHQRRRAGSHLRHRRLDRYVVRWTGEDIQYRGLPLCRGANRSLSSVGEIGPHYPERRELWRALCNRTWPDWP